MSDRRYSLQEMQDRCAIEDLYDRQLAASETFDFVVYDTTFTQDAKLDLSDFGLGPCTYPEFRQWLSDLQSIIVKAQRIRGGLRMSLNGYRATVECPVDCHVTMASAEGAQLNHTGVLYQDVLERRPEGWRIVSRVESLAWSG